VGEGLNGHLEGALVRLECARKFYLMEVRKPGSRVYMYQRILIVVRSEQF
jgi:hypothetical protein